MYVHIYIYIHIYICNVQCVYTYIYIYIYICNKEPSVIMLLLMSNDTADMCVPSPRPAMDEDCCRQAT